MRPLPLVSVIIPNYNYGEYLAEALQGLQEQTYVNWEAIVVDNHSTDTTDAVLEVFRGDSRIKSIKVQNGGSIAVSRNIGIQHATGEVLAFLDSDDYWFSRKLELAVLGYVNGAEVTYHNLGVMRGQAGKRSLRVLRTWNLRKPVLLDLLRRGNALLNSSVCVSRNLVSEIGPMNENRDLAGVEDYAYWLSIAEKTDSFVRLKGSLGLYRVHKGSASRNDTSPALAIAVEPYLKLLEPREVKRISATGAYVRLSRDFKLGTGHYWGPDAAQILKYGMLKFRIRVIVMLVLGLGHSWR